MSGKSRSLLLKLLAERHRHGKSGDGVLGSGEKAHDHTIVRLRQTLFPAQQRHVAFDPREQPHQPRRSVSPGWDVALQLAELAQTRHNSREVATTLEWMLRHGRFPPHAWQLTLQLLEHWRRVAAAAPPMEVDASSARRLPDRLSGDAAVQLAYSLSCASSSTLQQRARTSRCSDYSETDHTLGGRRSGTTHESEDSAALMALQVYQNAVATAAAESNHSDTGSGSREAASPHSSHRQPSPPVSRRHLTALRHISLVALLRESRWERALQMLRHTLSCQELPDPATTGLLLRVLGAAGQWEAALGVQELCLQVLQAAHRLAASDPAKRQPLARQWGTTLSLGMAAVAALQPHLCGPMLGDVIAARGELPHPVATLDGQFLAAVEQVPSEAERLALLRRARGAGVLDMHRLIRGLCSKRRWIEALALFAEASRVGALSRRETGQNRLHLLGACDAACAPVVLRTLQDLRSGLGSNNTFKVNDAEAECFLSRSLTAGDVSSREDQLDFWRCVRRIMHDNFSPLKPGRLVESSGTESGGPHRRIASLAMLSFLVRDPELSWLTALQVYEQGCTQRGARQRRPSFLSAGEAASPRPAGGATWTEPHSRAVLFTSVVERLYRSGDRGTEVADGLVIHAYKSEKLLPPKSFFLNGSVSAVRSLLETADSPAAVRALVPEKLVFALLHEEAESRREATVTLDGFRLPRPLTVLAALMQSAVGFDFTSPQSTLSATGTACLTWMETYSFSVHSEVIRCLRAHVALAPSPSARDALQHSIRYFSIMRRGYAAHLAQLERDPSRSREMKHSQVAQGFYTVFFELLLTLVEAPEASLPLSPECLDGGDSTTITAEDESIPLLALRQPPLSAPRQSLVEELVHLVVVHLRCPPPTHALLSSQMDRLLPPPKSPAATELLLAEGGGSRAAALRCLVGATIESLAARRQRRGAKNSTSALRGPPEGVEVGQLVNLTKLLCRLAEYAAAAAAETPPGTRSAATAPQPDAQAALRLLQWQVAWFGRRSVRGPSVALLYYLCFHCGGDWQTALRATQVLCGAAGNHGSGPPHERKNSTPITRYGHPAVGRNQYRLYASLFGWERALSFWYTQQPQAVLERVAQNPVAVDYCLSLTKE